MTRPAPLSDRVREVIPRLERVSRDVALRHGYSKNDLFQIACEEAVRFEAEFRPGEASFATAVFKAVYGAINDYIDKDRRDHRLRKDLAAVACTSAETAGDNEDGTTPNLFHESEATIKARFGVAKQRLVGSMFLGLLATATDPETAYLLEEERALMRAALDLVFDDFDGEDRIILERHFRDGEDLKGVLASLPGWGAKSYVTGWRYVEGTLRNELFEAFWVRGIGPDTSRRLIGRMR